ncbi:MAG: Arc family DNA-binding protein [Pirellulales bacterium]|nr:Arc family DNA-binding protein [Pirellulales bacterium]
MATVTVKNIPDEIYERLKQSAKASHRSINGEIIACIERAVQERRRVEEILAHARKSRELTKSHPLTDEELNRAKNIGRL